MLTPINHRPATDLVAMDILKTIDQNPAAFDLMVFKANYEDQEYTTEVPDLVGSMEAREKTISFSEPIITRGVLLPPDLTGSLMLAPGFGALDDGLDAPIMALIREPGIPEQSVVWMEEIQPDDTIRVTLLYVLKSEAIGVNGAAGSRHVLLPFNQGLDVLPDIYTDDDMPQWLPKPVDKTMKDRLQAFVEALPDEADLAILEESVPDVYTSETITEESLNRQARAMEPKFDVLADFVRELQSEPSPDATGFDVYAAAAHLFNTIDGAELRSQLPTRYEVDGITDESLNRQARSAVDNVGDLTDLFRKLNELKE